MANPIIYNIPPSGWTNQQIAKYDKTTCTGKINYLSITPVPSTPEPSWWSDNVLITKDEPVGDTYGYILLKFPANDDPISGRNQDAIIGYSNDVGTHVEVDVKLCQESRQPLPAKLKIIKTDSSSVNLECDGNTTVNKDTFTDITITDIESVKIGNCVEKFSGLAGATSLTSITISDSVKEFGNDEGSGNYAIGVSETALKSVIIPENVEILSKSAFVNNKKLESVTFANNSKLTKIGKYCFNNCEKLTSIIIPKSVTEIVDYGMNYCTGLTSVTFEENSRLTSIGSNVFAQDKSLTSITIPDSVEEINTYCFIDCIGLKTAHISTGITSISEGLFSGCKNLETVNIPTGITSIGTHSFYYCFKLANVSNTSKEFHIYNTVTSVGDGAFQACKDLEKVVYDTPVKVTTIENDTFRICTSLTTIEIPTTITSIGSRAFDSCSGLTSLTIPENVTSIGEYAFTNCYGFTSIGLLGSNTSLKLPNTITRIEDGLFYQCMNLTAVTIPSNVTYIGAYAFNMCNKLTSFTIPNSVETIGEEAFRSDSLITNINIPDSVKTLGKHCFYFCKLTSVTIGTGITVIDDGAFAEYDVEVDGAVVPINLALTCKATTPPSLGSNVFYNTTLISIKVPSGSVNAYKTASGWSDYASIITAI